MDSSIFLNFRHFWGSLKKIKKGIISKLILAEILRIGYPGSLMMQKGTIVASRPTAANTLGQSEDSEAGASDPAWCFPDRALGSAWSMCYYLENLGEPLWGKVEAPPSQAGQSAPTPACWGSLQGVACGSSWCHAGPREAGFRETEGPLGGDAGLAPRSQLCTTQL